MEPSTSKASRPPPPPRAREPRDEETCSQQAGRKLETEMDAIGWDAFAADHICLSQSMHKIIYRCVFKLHIAYYTTSVSTNTLAYTNIHPPYIQYHTNISPYCGLGSRAFVEEQSMVSSQSLSTMDAATVEPIWTLEQGGFPDEARGRASGILARVEFFPAKIRCFVGNKNWGLVKFWSKFPCLGSLYCFMIHNPYFAG